MIDMTTVVQRAAQRSHDLICPEPGDCPGPSERELTAAAAVLASALPTIFTELDRDATSVLHAMSLGKFTPGAPDATSENAEQLLRRWFHWWRTTEDVLVLPDGLPVRTVAYLTAQAVAAGRRVRTAADV
jgi:hypothetical protein